PPGGAGVPQALLVKVFASSGTTVVAAYSVGQQLAIAAFTAIVGLCAIVFIFRFRSFKEVIFAGRASREAERESEEESEFAWEDGPVRGDAGAATGGPPPARRARHCRRARASR